jgi:hypothetical protein
VLSACILLPQCEIRKSTHLKKLLSGNLNFLNENATLQSLFERIVLLMMFFTVSFAV